MIPKVVHYCWFGEKKMPKLAVRCIESWKRHLPEYELKLWNEETFDINSNEYVKEAYLSKKFAFVTDYIRLFVLYKHGGVYMDTDVEVVRNIDQFLSLPAFSGFETQNNIPTGIIGSCQYGQWVKEQLDYYTNRHFILPDGSMDTTSNTITISRIMKAGGFMFDNSIQDYQGIITFYPSDYFCPKNYDTGEIKLTENTYCIHHFSASWISDGEKFKRLIAKTIGQENLKPIITLKRRLLNFIRFY
jgi:mannosyltransferase OCH1-like enzyme